MICHKISSIDTYKLVCRQLKVSLSNLNSYTIHSHLNHSTYLMAMLWRSGGLVVVVRNVETPLELRRCSLHAFRLRFRAYIAPVETFLWSSDFTKAFDWVDHSRIWRKMVLNKSFLSVLVVVDIQRNKMYCYISFFV